MRDLLRTLAGILLVLVIGWGGFRILFGEDEVVPLIVQVVEGTVTHVDAEGSRAPARPGQPLDPLDRIETAGDGRAVLALGESSTLALQEATAIRVLGVSPDGLRVELDEGRVEATVGPERGTLGIIHEGREVVASNATFAVGIGSGGALAVESRVGSVEVVGVKDVSTLGEGQRLVVSPEGAARLAAIPEALLLEVAWPEAARTREAEVTVRGRTDPGAEVRVGASGRWNTVIADTSGNFEAVVPLIEGVNPLQVITLDPLGRSESVESSVTRDSLPPGGSTFEVKY